MAARVARTLRLVVGEWRWPVVPGVQPARSGGCSCGDAGCREPGAHPVDTASWLAASADPDRVREWWLAAPLAAVVLPVGWHVDVIDAPESGGREALGRLEMMGYRPAPAISTAAGRLLFLVAAGARRTADFAERRGRGRGRKGTGAGGSALPTQPGPETGLWLGGDCSGAPDIVVRRRGVLVLPPIGPEPPGVTRWLVEPDPVRRPLPRAEDVLGPIVHACRDIAARRQHRSTRLADAVGGRSRPTEAGASASGAGSASGSVSGAGADSAAVSGAGSSGRAGSSGAAGSWGGAARSGAGVDATGAAGSAGAGGAGGAPARRLPLPAAMAGAGRRQVPPTVGSAAGGDRARVAPTEPCGAGPRTVARRGATRSVGRPANGAGGRRVAAGDRRSEAVSAAWKERLRRVRPEPPPASA
jgi:hypothetical protein